MVKTVGVRLESFLSSMMREFENHYTILVGIEFDLSQGPLKRLPSPQSFRARMRLALSIQPRQTSAKLYAGGKQ